MGCSLDLLTREAEAAVRAFEATWGKERRQIISSDAAFRDLYETSAEHAFQELWEQRLGQSAQSLAILGRPVLGGGLRFVMPPLPDEVEPLQIEVKIESFLRDTKKLFVETQFAWPAPTSPGAPFDPAGKLKQLDDYIEHVVTSFLVGGTA